MNKYFNIILENNKEVFISIEKILTKYLLKYDFYNTPNELKKQKILEDIEKNESIIVFFDSMYLKDNLISVSLKNNILPDIDNAIKELINKVSYSVDYKNSSLKCEAIVLTQKIQNNILKTYITSEDCIYKDILVKNINFIFEDGKIIDEDYLSIAFSTNQYISINSASLAYEKCEKENQSGFYNALTDLKFFISLYHINKTYLHDFLFSGVPFPPVYVDTLLLEHDISIEEKLKDIKKFSININEINFDLIIEKMEGTESE